MPSLHYRKIIALVIAIVVLIGGSTAWWLYNKGNVTLQEVGIQGASAILQYDVSNPRLVNLLWQEIRGNNNTINIYRSKDNVTWELWKQVVVSDENGKLTFEAAEGESARDYQYYVEIVTEDGQTTIILPPSPLAPPTPDSGGTSTSSTSTAPTPAGGSTTTTSTNPGDVPPVQPPATTTPPAVTTTTPPTTPQPAAPYTSYYTPNGQLSGTSSIPLITDTFWVRHYANNIELGWQNLPSDVSSVWISRSDSSAGPWMRLLQHDNVAGLQSGSIQFFDGSIHDDHYYLLEAVRTNSTTTLGPILLEGLP